MTPEELQQFTAEVAELFRERLAGYASNGRIDKPLMTKLAAELNGVIQSLHEGFEPPLIVVKPDGPDRVRIVVHLTPPADNIDLKLDIQ